MGRSFPSRKVGRAPPWRCETAMSPKVNLLHRLSDGQSWVRVPLRLDSASFTREHVRALERGAAEYLGLGPDEVKTLSVTRWEPEVVLQMPRKSAKWLVTSFARPDRRFQAFLETVPIGDVAEDLPRVRPVSRPGAPKASSIFEWARPVGVLIGGTVLGLVFAIPALVLGIARGIGRFSNGRGKPLSMYAAGMALPVALFVFVRISEAGKWNAKSDLASLVAITFFGIAAYLNVSAIHHLRQSVAYTDQQVVLQVWAVSIFLIAGAVVVLYVLGEDDRRSWRSGLLLSPWALRAIMGGTPRRSS